MTKIDNMRYLARYKIIKKHIRLAVHLRQAATATAKQDDLFFQGKHITCATKNPDSAFITYTKKKKACRSKLSQTNFETACKEHTFILREQPCRTSPHKPTSLSAQSCVP